MRNLTIIAALLSALMLGSAPLTADAAEDPQAIPFSSIASPEARLAWEAEKAKIAGWPFRERFRQIAQMTSRERRALLADVSAWDTTANWKPLLIKQKATYKVDIKSAMIAGVYTEIFTPRKGVLPSNIDRVLINLHGGGFTSGARIGGQVESIPISAVGRIKVISIDYRQAPAYQFPAATDDVVAVYRELLKTYKPGNVGIYGCSAGATLTAQVTASIMATKMPRPGAIGMFCGTGEIWARGDSAYFFAMLNGNSPASAEQNPQDFDYFRGLDSSDPLMFPMRHPESLNGFPPSLLISGTRAIDMSTVVDANNQLAAVGVDTKLHIWDGVTHGFIWNPDLPESRQAYEIISHFFAEKLGPWYRPELQAFLAADLMSKPPRCSVLFTGSSSIRLWDGIRDDLAPATVLNRGFGGAVIEDINDVFDRVITPYWPKAIFFYAGENDLSYYRRSPAEVLIAFQRFMSLKTVRLGNVPVYFLSIKPSKLYWPDLHLQQEANRLIRQFAVTRADLHYVDVATPMIGHGKVRDIFKADDLHLTPEGYRIWTSKLRPLVLREAVRTVPGCRGTLSKNTAR